MITTKNLIKLISFDKKLICHRFLASQVNPQAKQFVQKNDPDWENALPFESIPGPTKFGLLRSSLYNGKYYKKSRLELIKMFQSEYGDILRIPAFMGLPDIVFLYDPQYFQTIYRTEGIWPKRLALETLKYYREVVNPEIFAVGTLITDQGERWAKFRSAVNPVMMQPKTIRIYVPRMDKIASQFIERIRKIRDPVTEEVPGTFQEELNHWSLESVCVVALDRELGLINNIDQNPDAKKIRNAVSEIFKSPVDTGINLPLWKYFKTKSFTNLMNAYDTLTKISIKYIDEALERFKLNLNPERKEVEKSIVERLTAIDKKVAVVMALEMFFAGVDTTTSALTGCLLTLSKNPDKQEKLRSELKKILPEKDTELTEEKLKNLPYLRAVIKESLRMFPVAMENARAVGEDIVIKNYRIPKGTDVLMANGHLYKNDKHFTQSDKFIPERWLRNTDKSVEAGCPVGEKSSNPFIYLPFGFGTRMCIGKRIVEMELEIALAKIIRNFHVEFNYSDDDVFAMFLINTPVKKLKFKFVDVE